MYSVAPSDQPGELWLENLSGQPQRVLPRSLYQSGQSYTDNKLVLGHAGSGRSMLLSKLTHSAHQAGNEVVVIQTTNHFSNLQHLITLLQGALRPVASGRDARFNLFIIPDGADQHTVDRVIQLLLLVLRSELPVPAPALRSTTHQLARYIKAFISRNLPGPDFNTFAEFVAMMKETPSLTDTHQAFHCWFTQAAAPFCTGGRYEHLLNATPAEISQLLTSQNRWLLFDLKLDESFREPETHPGARAPHHAPLSSQRVLWLLLHSVDLFLASPRPARQLTVVLDFLDAALLGPLTLEYLEGHVREWRTFWRETIFSWQQVPQELLSTATHITRFVDCVLFVGRHTPGAYLDELLYNLGIGKESQQRIEAIKPRQVLCRLGPTYQIFNARYSDSELLMYSAQQARWAGLHLT